MIFFLAKLSFQKSEKVVFTDLQTFTHIYFKLLFSLKSMPPKEVLSDHRLQTLREDFKIIVALLKGTCDTARDNENL